MRYWAVCKECDYTKEIRETQGAYYHAVLPEFITHWHVLSRLLDRPVPLLKHECTIVGTKK